MEHAYRNIPVHPEDRHLLGMAWRGRLYIDTTLPFGLRSAPKIFTAVADALEWVLLRDGLSWSIHYIDDFLTAGCAGTEECASNLRTIKSTCEWLGVPLKWSKVEGPTTELTFLGNVLDTIKGEIRLPQEKLGQLASLVSAWSHRKQLVKRWLWAVSDCQGPPQWCQRCPGAGEAPVTRGGKANTPCQLGDCKYAPHGVSDTHCMEGGTKYKGWKENHPF